MTSEERLLIAASFQEPDRVPVELCIGQKARQLPETQKIVEFIDTTADNFLGVPGADWGFFGLSSEYSAEIIEDIPGEFRRIRRTQRTQAGDFYAITKHFYPNVDSADYHWERRYIDTLEEMERLADAPRSLSRIFHWITSWQCMTKITRASNNRIERDSGKAAVLALRPAVRFYLLPCASALLFFLRAD